MLRTNQELSKCRNQLAQWYGLRREVARMIRTGQLVDASDLVDVLNKHVDRLKEEIDRYLLPYRESDQECPFDVLRQAPRIPEALVKVRIRLGLSQRQFARIAKMSAQQLSRYERTRFANLTLKRAAELARGLESQLFRPESEPKTDES